MVIFTSLTLPTANKNVNRVLCNEVAFVQPLEWTRENVVFPAVTPSAVIDHTPCEEHARMQAVQVKFVDNRLLDI